jgi:hypothetical protein
MLLKLVGILCAMLALPVAAATFQSANVHRFDTGEDVAGAGTMTRGDDGVSVRIALSGLDKKSTYSIWWIVFNDPAQCIGGIGACGALDLGPTAPANSAVINAAGFVTGTDGVANFTSELQVGPTPTGIANPFGNLENADMAEIHMVIQSHGKSLAGSVNAQMTIPGAACSPACEDQFAIAFLPIMP